MESLQPTPLMAFDHSKIELVCAVHVFTSVAQCIGSILSWVSFRESSENLLADIEFCIVLQYCCHVVRQTCIEVPAKQMSVENPLDSANLRGTINFACLFLLRKYVNYWLQFWMFLMSIGTHLLFTFFSFVFCSEPTNMINTVNMVAFEQI